jgi:peroxiredoxin
MTKGMNRALADARTQHGQTLESLAQERPLLLVFLRHFGCPFCREAVADIAARRSTMDASGTQVAFVHMHPEEQAAEYFARYGVGDLPRVSDPGARVYDAFGLTQATPTAFLGWHTLKRYGEAIVGGGHMPAIVGGRLRQMPGAFLLVDGKLVKAFRHASVGDRLDLDDLARVDAAHPL